MSTLHLTPSGDPQSPIGWWNERGNCGGREGREKKDIWRGSEGRERREGKHRYKLTYENNAMAILNRVLYFN